MTTVSTVGYGDRYPVTLAGRLTAVLLIGACVSLFGVTTAAVAAYFIRRVTKDPAPEGEDLPARLKRLQAAVARIEDARATESQRHIGKLLVAVIIDRGAGAGFHWLLHTADAHSMYAGFGFAPPNATLMERSGDRRTTPPAGQPPPGRARHSFRRAHRAAHTLGRERFSSGAGRLAALGKAILLRNRLEP